MTKHKKGSVFGQAIIVIGARHRLNTGLTDAENK